MKTFTDNTGRTWTLSVTVGTIKRVRALCGVDLANIITMESGKTPNVGLLERLASDPVLLVVIPFFWSMCFLRSASPRRMQKELPMKNSAAPWQETPLSLPRRLCWTRSSIFSPRRSERCSGRSSTRAAASRHEASRR